LNHLIYFVILFNNYDIVSYKNFLQSHINMILKFLLVLQINLLC